MDHETYSNPEVAQLINNAFIAIRVDRDERPDIDARYQQAVQAITGHGIYDPRREGLLRRRNLFPR
jgi:hypothetical protein